MKSNLLEIMRNNQQKYTVESVDNSPRIPPTAMNIDLKKEKKDMERICSNLKVLENLKAPF